VELEDAVQTARNFCELHGLGYFNICFYKLPIPRGFQYRNWIALSADFVRLNSWDEVYRTIAHEGSHAWTYQEGRDAHDSDWQWKAEEFGARTTEDRLFSPEYERMISAYKLDSPLYEAGERFLARIVEVLDRRVENLQLNKFVDLTSFMDPPTIQRRFDCDSD
jgi:hypothetical protein